VKSMNIKFDLFPQEKTRTLTMSYDDGQVFDRRLVEIFNKYEIKGANETNWPLLFIWIIYQQFRYFFKAALTAPGPKIISPK
jgi:hypothetical protein